MLFAWLNTTAATGCAGDSDILWMESGMSALLLGTMADFDSRANELLAMKRGWNGYTSPPIEAACMDRAREFYRQFRGRGHSICMVPLSNGGVQVEWMNGEHECSVEFEPGKESVTA